MAIFSSCGEDWLLRVNFSSLPRVLPAARLHSVLSLACFELFLQTSCSSGSTRWKEGMTARATLAFRQRLRQVDMQKMVYGNVGKGQRFVWQLLLNANKKKRIFLIPTAGQYQRTAHVTNVNCGGFTPLILQLKSRSGNDRSGGGGGGECARIIMYCGMNS